MPHGRGDGDDRESARRGRVRLGRRAADVMEVRALGGFQYFCPGSSCRMETRSSRRNVPVTLDGMAVSPATCCTAT